ncbi:unnamed protein product [Auanema sp. JU1783]|nr:unnamed protein product [Auanema sp. JU1783]
MLVEPAQSEPPGFDCPTFELASDLESPQTDDELNMASVTIKIDEEPSDSGAFLHPDSHVARRDSTSRRSVRRNRASSAVAETLNVPDQMDAIPSVTRNMRKLNSLDNVLKWFQGDSKNSTKKSKEPKEYEPGLRSLIYNLNKKMEKEEKNLQKRQKKEKS